MLHASTQPPMPAFQHYSSVTASYLLFGLGVECAFPIAGTAKTGAGTFPLHGAPVSASGDVGNLIQRLLLK